MEQNPQNIWAQLLFRGQQIGISPRDFWRLSLREWRAINGEINAQKPMCKSEFEDLARTFED